MKALQPALAGFVFVTGDGDPLRPVWKACGDRLGMTEPLLRDVPMEW
ncbi:hypothetical protein [Microbispora sp. NPDC046933]